MKNRPFSLLAAITLVFAGFICGFLVGRNATQEAITISIPEEMMTLPPPTETEQEIIYPLDLNKAGKEEILSLPGIGEKLTLRILAYRREKGRFWSVADLLKVEGITENMLEDIQDLVTVGG